MNMYFDGVFSQFLQMDSFHKKNAYLNPGYEGFFSLVCKIKSQDACLHALRPHVHNMMVTLQNTSEYYMYSAKPSSWSLSFFFKQVSNKKYYMKIIRNPHHPPTVEHFFFVEHIVSPHQNSEHEIKSYPQFNNYPNHQLRRSEIKEG